MHACQSSIRFQRSDAAAKAYAKYSDQSVWKMKTPTFDASSKSEYNSCPIKAVVLLMKPTIMTLVTPVQLQVLEYPSKYLDVRMDLKGILQILAKMPFANTASRPGSARPPSKVLDFCGKKMSLSASQTRIKASKSLTVAEMECIDCSGGKIQVSVWDDAITKLKKIPDGEGITCIGSTALREDKDVKLSLWDSAHIIRGGAVAQSLTGLDSSSISTELLTAAFVPSHAPIDVAKPAHPTCAAALVEAIGCTEDKVFQFNRAFLDAPTREEALYTKDKRLFVQCRLYDRTGCVDVDVISSAVPAPYGCTDESEIKRKLLDGTLESQLFR